MFGVAWGKVIPIVGRVLTAIMIGVPSVETLARLRGGSTGAEKKHAVLELVQAELSAVELAAGRDLAHDADVIAAAGTIIDAYVAFQNLLAQKTAAGV